MIKIKTATDNTCTFISKNKALESIVDSITTKQMSRAFGEPTYREDNYWLEWMFHIDGLPYQYGIAFRKGEPRIRTTWLDHHDHDLDIPVSLFLSYLCETIKNKKVKKST